MPDDRAELLAEAVRGAGAEGRKLTIFGSGSKAGRALGGQGFAASTAVDDLLVTDHAGVIDHRPEELVLTARCGTALQDINALLAQHRQHLPFEPPMIAGGGTLGGAVATGWSGPGRPWRGALRDALLGVEMVNGLGQRLRFGGQVMKNVAGYDLSRLQAGAWGSLGVLLSVSLRVSPMPYVERNCRLQCGAQQALAWMRTWARRFSPISGTCHHDGVLDMRLSGPETAVQAAAARIGGELSSDLSHWSALRDRALPIFQGEGSGAERLGGSLWQIHCASAAPLPPGPCLIEWAGARRWWHTQKSADEVRAYAESVGGVALPAGGAPDFQGPIMGRLKQAFDPKGVLNPHLLPSDQV